MGRVRPHPLLEKLQEWPGEKSEVCAEVIAKLKSSKDLADELIGYHAEWKLTELAEDENLPASDRLSLTQTLCTLLASCSDPGMTLISVPQGNDTADPLTFFVSLISGVRSEMSYEQQEMAVVSLDFFDRLCASEGGARSVLADAGLLRALQGALRVACEAIGGAEKPSFWSTLTQAVLSCVSSLVALEGNLCHRALGDAGFVSSLAACAGPEQSSPLRAAAFEAAEALSCCGTLAREVEGLLAPAVEAVVGGVTDAGEEGARAVLEASLDALQTLCSEPALALRATEAGLLRHGLGWATRGPVSVRRKALHALAAVAASDALLRRRVAALPDLIATLRRNLGPEVGAGPAGDGEGEGEREGEGAGTKVDEDESPTDRHGLVRAVSMVLEQVVGDEGGRSAVVAAGLHEALAGHLIKRLDKDSVLVVSGCLVLEMLARKGPAIAAKDLACTSPSLVDALHQSMSHDRRSSRITSDEFDAKYRLFRELTPLRRRAVGLVAATVAGFGVGEYFVPSWMLAVAASAVLLRGSDAFELHATVFPWAATLAMATAVACVAVSWVAQTVAVRAAVGLLLWVSVFVILWILQGGQLFSRMTATVGGLVTLQGALHALLGGRVALVVVASLSFLLEMLL